MDHILDRLAQNLDVSQLIGLLKQITGMGNLENMFNLSYLLYIFIWYALYRFVKVRAVGTMDLPDIVLMGGALVGVLANVIMLSVEFVYENISLQERVALALFQPLYHCLNSIIRMCVAFYAINCIGMWTPTVRKIFLGIGAGIPAVLIIKYSVDATPLLQWETSVYNALFHIVSALICGFTLSLFMMRYNLRMKGNLTAYFTLALIFNVLSSTKLFMPMTERTETILDNMALWSVGLIHLHVVTNYAWKLFTLEETIRIGELCHENKESNNS
jgi:hypothetical protein